MPRVEWPLRHCRPNVQIILTLALGGQALPRVLLADSGAGSLLSGFELILEEDDCLLCAGISVQPINLSGAYVGSFPLYDVPIQVPALGFGKDPVWYITVASLGAELQFRQDSTTHGLIEPARTMPIVDLQNALAATKPRWQKLP